MVFTIGGAEFELTREQVELRLANVEPEELKQVFVVVGDRKFPIKQALAIGANIVRSGFTTQDALRILRKLGFEVGERPVTFQLRTKAIAGFPQFWDTAIEAFPNFWPVSREVIPLSNEVFKVAVNDRLHILTRSLVKSVVNSFGSLLLLCMNGYGFDALKIVRSMFEAMVTVAHLRQHPEDIDDFVDYEYIKKQRFVEDLQQYAPELAKSHAHEIPEILRNYKSVVDRFKTKNGSIRPRWSKESLAKLASDLNFSAQYWSIYSPGSSAQHMDIRGIMMQFDGERSLNSADIVTAPNLHLIQPVLAGGHISVVVAVTTYMEIAGIDRSDIERKLVEGLHTAWPTRGAASNSPSNI